MIRLLIIEDDIKIRDHIIQLAQRMEFRVVAPDKVEKGFELLGSNDFDLVIIEANPSIKTTFIEPWIKDDTGGLSGRSYLPIFIGPLLEKGNVPEFIIVARGGFSAEAKFATDKGAIDYIQIPQLRNKEDALEFDLKRFEERLSAGFNRAVNKIERSKLIPLDLNGVIGSSRLIKSALLTLADASRNDLNVLIVGETGTGKKLFSKKIHENSSRKGNDFVFVDCTSFQLPETNSNYLDSLFSNKKLKATTAGTILFNEIGYLPIGLQGKLLPLLQENSHAVDGNDGIKMPAYRILTTSSQNLRELIDASRFREDLYYELGTMELSLPPLRERLEDIPLISEHFIENLQQKFNKGGPFEMSRDFIAALKGYSWPGNITELFNVLRVIISDVTDGQVLSSAFLPQKILSQSAGDIFNSSIGLDEISVEEIFSSINQPGEKLDFSNTYSQPSIEGKLLQTGDSELRFCFYETGQYWKFGHPEKPVRLKKLKGYEFIHFLLQYPNKDFRPFVVYHLGKSEPGNGASLEKYTDLVERDNPDPIYEKMGQFNEGQIKNVIKHLEDKLSAQDFDNPQEACEIEDQIKSLKNWGKRKFERDPHSSHEKSRSNITRAISRALKEITKHAPYLEQYLNASTIKTGDHMCYRPLPGNEPTWILDQE